LIPSQAAKIVRHADQGSVGLGCCGANFIGSALAEKRIWDVGYNGAYALAGVMLAGLLLTWWARLLS
jgi:hypothetical protein